MANDASAAALTINPLDETAYKDVIVAVDPGAPIYNASELQYQTYLETRLMRAQTMRDRAWAEFSDKTYLRQFEENEKAANTYIPKRTNEDDVQVTTGTIEGKLGVLLANIDAMNIVPEVLAFDHSDMPLNELAMAMTDIMDRCAENDGGIDGGDQEKRQMRQRELLKQGTVFVQDRWVCKYQPKKNVDGTYNGEFRWNAWTTKLEAVFEGPERVLLYGPNVFLGDITVFSMDDQPYVFTVETMHHDTARGLFGSFEMWKYVHPGVAPKPAVTMGLGGRTIYDGKFRLTTLKDDQVEVIKYQDPTRDEFQIMINGIMMLPIGFPLSAVTPGGKYNIAKQVLIPINAQFAYGKSFVMSGDIYEISKLADEMLKLFVLKTRKSVTPAYLNNSGRVISKRVLSPGNITMGVPPGALTAIGTESQGVTNGEYQMYKELLDRINSSTVSPIFQGQVGSHLTATQVMQLQQAAKLSLGLIVAACTLLEIKLGYLRLPVIIANWFNPTGQTNTSDGIRNAYRSVSKTTAIDGTGEGIRKIIPVDGQLPDPAVVRGFEIASEQQTGKPFQYIFVSVPKLREERVTWRVIASPKPTASGAYEKTQFTELLNGVLALMNVGSKPNITGLETQFASVYGVDRSKVFANPNDMQPGMGQPQPQQPGQNMQEVAQRVAGDLKSGNMPAAPTITPPPIAKAGQGP